MAPKSLFRNRLALLAVGAALLVSCNNSSAGNAGPGGSGSGGSTTEPGSGGSGGSPATPGSGGSTSGSGGAGAMDAGSVAPEAGSGGSGSGGSNNGSGGASAMDAPAAVPEVGPESGPIGGPSEIPDGGGPSADALAGQQALKIRLDAITSKIPNTHTLFIDCTVEPCTARMDAPTLPVMRTLLLAVSAEFQGRIDFTVVHHLDAFTGGTYQADLVLGTDHKRAIPDDPNALLSE